ncbi:hypothetical protein BaRGS_00003956 [Batillaria attramentaria]|uniref:Uncharacterized protein n=1 Tax=Batillaria attramentaria TaxID=370345 RepID=A0ABD0M0L0_9CAEN
MLNWHFCHVHLGAHALERRPEHISEVKLISGGGWVYAAGGAAERLSGLECRKPSCLQLLLWGRTSVTIKLIPFESGWL